MYDELIKALRNMSKMGTKYGMAVVRMREAADAIEELIIKLNHADEQIEKLVEAAEERCWIPVTEQLPKAERKSYWVCTDTGYQCQCRWTNNPFGMGESDEWSFSIFDIPQYQKVVAWRVLPQPYTPPKGEDDADTSNKKEMV